MAGADPSAFSFTDPLAKTLENEDDLHLDDVYEPSYTSSGNWSVIEDLDASVELVSDADASSSVSANPPKISDVLALPNTLLLSNEGSDLLPDATSDSEYDPSLRASSPDRDSPEPQQNPVPKEHEEHKATCAAIERFLSEDFLEEGTQEDVTQHVQQPQSPPPPPKATTAIDSARTFFPNSSELSSTELYHKISLRRWKVQTDHQERELLATGKKPDAEWRWCGFPNCESGACRYASVGEKEARRQVVSSRDIVAANLVLTRLLAAFRQALRDQPCADVDAHVLVAFATSPPILRAVSDCKPLFFSDEAEVAGTILFVDSFETAAREFGELKEAIAVMNAQELAQLHGGARFLIEDDRERSMTASGLALRFLMRAEAWRRRQAGEGYPWNWTNAGAVVAVSRVILDTYRRLFNEGHVVLEMEPRGRALERVWRRWLDRFRPWNDCQVQYLCYLEAAEGRGKKRLTVKIVDADDDEESEVIQGVGLNKGCWWPNRSRAGGVDESRNH